MRTKHPVVQQRYVSLEEAAEWYGCTQRTIRNRIREGVLPAYRLGRGPKARIRIAVEDLEKLLQPIPSAGRSA